MSFNYDKSPGNGANTFGSRKRSSKKKVDSIVSGFRSKGKSSNRKNHKKEDISGRSSNLQMYTPSNNGTKSAMNSANFN